MSARARAIWMVVIVGLCLMIPVDPARATEVSVLTNRSSCVFSLSGWSDVTSNLSWGITDRTLSAKCYYQAGAPSGFAGYWPSSWANGNAAPTFDQCVYLARDSSTNTLIYNPTNTTQPFRWDVRTTVDSSDRYVEFTLTIKRSAVINGASVTFTDDRAQIIFDPNCNGGGSDAYSLGDTAADSPLLSAWVDSDDFATIMPAYRWGPAADLTACEAINISSPWSDSRIVYGGEDVPLDVEYNPGYPVGIVEIQFKYAGAWSVVQPADYDGPDEYSVTIQKPANEAETRLGDALIRCWDPTTQDYKFIRFDSQGELVDGNARSCALIKLSWPQVDNDELQAGEVYEFTVQFTGEGQPPEGSTVDIELAQWDAEGDVPSFSTLDYTPVVTDLGIGEVEVFNVGAEYDGPLLSLVFRCVDEAGLFYQGTFSGSYHYTIPKPPQDCISSSGLGLSPKSWVPGLVRMGQCTLVAMFVPQSFTFDSFTEEFDDTFVADVFDSVGGVASFFTSMSSSYGASCEGSAIDMPLGGTDEVSVNFTRACDEPVATFRNVAYTLQYMSLLLFGTIAMARAGMELVGAGGMYYGQDELWHVEKGW